MGSQGVESPAGSTEAGTGSAWCRGPPPGAGGPLGVPSGVITAERRKAKRAVIEARFITCFKSKPRFRPLQSAKGERFQLIYLLIELNLYLKKRNAQ